MRIGAYERQTVVPVEASTNTGDALKQLNALATVANAFLFDLGGGPSAFGDLRFQGLGRKINKKLLDARIHADRLLRGIYLKNPDRFIQDGYLASDIASARAGVLRAMQDVYDDYQLPRRGKVTIPESTLARVRTALGK